MLQSPLIPSILSDILQLPCHLGTTKPNFQDALAHWRNESGHDKKHYHQADVVFLTISTLVKLRFAKSWFIDRSSRLHFSQKSFPYKSDRDSWSFSTVAVAFQQSAMYQYQQLSECHESHHRCVCMAWCYVNSPQKMDITLWFVDNFGRCYLLTFHLLSPQGMLIDQPNASANINSVGKTLKAVLLKGVPRCIHWDWPSDGIPRLWKVCTCSQW